MCCIYNFSSLFQDDQEKHQSEMLNTVAEQQFDIIDKMKQ